MKKILICSGDSFTDKEWTSDFYPDEDFNWPKWPELLGEKYNMQVVNLGRSGAGNEYIYHSILDYLTDTPKHMVGAVIAGWSQCHRKDFQVNGKWTNTRVDPHGDIYSFFNKTLRHYLSLQILCERYNLPCYQFQMIDPFRDYVTGLKFSDTDIAKGLASPTDKMFSMMGDGDSVKMQLYKNIMWWDRVMNTKNFYGWPIANDLNGKTMSENLTPDLRVSELDTHPNELGQIKIMEILYDWLGPRIPTQ